MYKNTVKNYFNNTSKIISECNIFEKQIILFARSIYKRKGKKKILVVGNGGSSADADHFVGELTCTYSSRKRSAHSAISLSSSSPGLTAWGNDFGFETYFERQVEANGNKGDILLILSTGGGNIKKNISKNLIYAAKIAKKKKLKVISLVGKSGGYLYKNSDISIKIKSNITSVIQEAHMTILHSICYYLEERL